MAIKYIHAENKDNYSQDRKVAKLVGNNRCEMSENMTGEISDYFDLNVL